MGGSVESRQLPGEQPMIWGGVLALAALVCLVTAAGLLLLRRPDPAAARFLVEMPSHERLEAGFTLYRQNCASCHGAFLSGEAGWQDDPLRAPALNETGHAFNHSDLDLFQQVAAGSRAPGGRVIMPAFRGKLSDDEIVTVLAYVTAWWSEKERMARLSPDWVFPATCSPGDGAAMSSAAGQN